MTTDIPAEKRTDLEREVRSLLRNIHRDALLGDWRPAVVHLVIAALAGVGFLVLHDPAALFGDPTRTEVVPPELATLGSIATGGAAVLALMNASWRSMLPSLMALLGAFGILLLQLTVGHSHRMLLAGCTTLLVSLVSLGIRCLNLRR